VASRARVDEYRSLNADLNELARRDLEAFWSRIDKTDIAAARDALADFMAALADTYGQSAALIAAQFYDDLRVASPHATGRYRAVVGGSTDREAIAGTARWAVGALTEDGEGSVVDRASGAMQRIISQYGRDTIALNSSRDPSAGAWARVPSGATTCGFCLSLASRGPVYRSAETAGEGRHYHDRCDCVPTQIWDGDDLPDGYDPDALYAQYLNAREAAGGNLQNIAAELDANRPR